MSANTRSRGQDFNTGMFVRQLNDFPNVQTQVVRDEGEFVGESDVYIPVGIFYKFHHFGCIAVSLMKGAVDEGAIKPDGSFGRDNVHPADDAVVINQFPENLSRENALWTIRNK